MKRLFITISIAALTLPAIADNVKATIHADQAGAKINREIYGQFSEHLGSCIYGGLWVGENSQIPNIQGYRKDVFEALKALKIPVMRWPGGCFADDYHWMDGIGPKEQRPSLRNNNWGGTIEDNSFGTHEFLNLCEMLGCEPYISGNVGSGTVKEMAQWVEYMTSDGDTPMARLRRQNGREKAWKVKYFGIGNEAWGCGGNMTPEYYSNEYRKFNTYLRDQGDNHLYRIASGASDYDYNWTKVLMQNIGRQMNGVSLHYYTCSGWEGLRVLLLILILTSITGHLLNASKSRRLLRNTRQSWMKQILRIRLVCSLMNGALGGMRSLVPFLGISINRMHFVMPLLLLSPECIPQIHRSCEDD